MAKENSAGLGVSTRYGPVAIPNGARGTYHSQDGLFYIVADWSADLINSDSINQAVTVVKNILPLRAWLEVEEALSLSGTSAGLAVGVQGAISADCAEVTGTAVGVGFATATLLGKFSTGLTATATIVVGVTSGSINAGAGRFVIECLKV